MPSFRFQCVSETAPVLGVGVRPALASPAARDPSGVDREAVVVARDLDRGRCPTFEHRLVHAAVAELQLVRVGRRAPAPSSWWPRQMPNTGHPARAARAGVDAVRRGRRVAGAVRQEHARRIPRQHLGRRRRRPGTPSSRSPSRPASRRMFRLMPKSYAATRNTRPSCRRAPGRPASARRRTAARVRRPPAARSAPSMPGCARTRSTSDAGVEIHGADRGPHGAPRPRMRRVSRRVSIPSIPTTPAAPRARPRASPVARHDEARRLASRTANPATCTRARLGVLRGSRRSCRRAGRSWSRSARRTTDRSGPPGSRPSPVLNTASPNASPGAPKARPRNARAVLQHEQRVGARVTRLTAVRLAAPATRRTAPRGQRVQHPARERLSQERASSGAIECERRSPTTHSAAGSNTTRFAGAAGRDRSAVLGRARGCAAGAVDSASIARSSVMRPGATSSRQQRPPARSRARSSRAAPGRTPASFSSTACGRVVGGDGVDRPVGEARPQRVPVLRRAQRRVHLEVRVVADEGLVGERQVVRRDVGRGPNARGLAPAGPGPPSRAARQVGHSAAARRSAGPAPGRARRRPPRPRRACPARPSSAE